MGWGMRRRLARAAGEEPFSEIGIKIMEASMTELAYLATRNIAQFQEQRRNKLQDAVSGIPPADQQQEIAGRSGQGCMGGR